MPKCPECKEEIDYLKNVQNIWISTPLSLNKKGQAIYDHKQRDEWEGDEVGTWNCPECDKELFTDEDEAIKFLKGV